MTTLKAGQPLVYEDHNRSANVTDVYEVVGENDDGSKTSGVTVSLR